MFSAFRHIWNDRTIRIATLTVFCVGFTYASTIPYFSLIGITQLGMSTTLYAAVSALTALMAMLAAVGLGFLSDRSPDRKRGVMLSLSIGLLGFGGFYLFPSVWTFTAFLLLITPVSGAAYSQLFAIIRSASNTRAPAEATQINSTARSTYALSWVVVPGLVGAYIATRQDVSDSFAIAALAFLVCLILFGVFGKPGGRAEPSKLTVWAGLKEAFGLVFSKHIALRILALAMIASVQWVSGSLLPLVIVKMPSGDTGVVGIFAGLTAGLEVPLMLLGGVFASRYPLWKIIVGGGLVYALYMGLVGFAHSVPQVYALSVLNAMGNAIMLTLHLSYLQNLLPDRPGLGTSLLSIAALVCKVIATGVFALSGTALGFSGAAIVGAVIAVVGCLMLLLLDRNPHRVS
jgi:Major Facilitator Superfamily